jgi:nucleolar protein 12
MSLLGSIFGNDLDDSRKDSDLFQKSSELPERPQHKPVARPKRHKEEQEEDEKSLNKKKRKERKPKKDVETEDEKADESKESKDMNNEDTDAQVKKSSDGDDKKEEKDEAERTVFVGNLSIASTTRRSLGKLFSDCGPIASTRIRSVPVKGIKLPTERAGDQNLMRKVSANTHQIDDSLKDTVTGYVVFRNIDSVPKAIEKNNTMVDGFRIRVDKSTPTVEPSRSVFCGNLPYGAEETSLQEHFVKGCDFDAADVEGVRIVRDKETFQCKGFGYVLLREKSLVATALKLHSSTYMGKQLRVLVCGKRFKNRKGEPAKPRYASPAEKEKISVGAFRRVVAKQQAEAAKMNKRKRGEKKKTVVAKKSGLSKRATIEKKVDQKVKKLQKRATKGMGKSKRS